MCFLLQPDIILKVGKEKKIKIHVVSIFAGKMNPPDTICSNFNDDESVP